MGEHEEEPEHEDEPEPEDPGQLAAGAARGLGLAADLVRDAGGEPQAGQCAARGEGRAAEVGATHGRRDERHGAQVLAQQDGRPEGTAQPDDR